MIVAGAIGLMRGPYRGLATVTKLLHLKRPALVPVLDSLALDLLGARGRGDADIVSFVAEVGTANLDALKDVQRHLANLTGWDGQPIERSLVRIFDAIVWSAHPASVMYPLLGPWPLALGVRGFRSEDR